jgi:uroporphyrinogen decarboxylase
MNSRERVFTALSHREPDRVPHNLRPSPEAVARLRLELGDPGADFAEHFGHDVRYASIPLPDAPEGTPKSGWTPLPPAPEAAACRDAVKRLQAAGCAVCGSYACGVFEQAKEWFGDAQTLAMPYEDPRRLDAALDRITEWKMAVYGAYVEAGVDIVWIGDDLGAQHSLIMSPAHYRRWYRPRHQRIVEHLRSLRSGVIIAFHCCGYVTALIPDLIALGVDVLEAVQPESMDLAGLKREFGRDLSFWGGIGAQSVLARTGRQAVLEGVRRAIEAMAPGGGYIAAPCHTLTEEVPWETVVACEDAVRLHGAYPLRRTGLQ